MDKYLKNMMTDLEDDIVEEISNMVPGISEVDHTHLSNKVFTEIGFKSKTIMKKEKYIRKANKSAKAVAFAACFCLVIGVGLFALPIMLNLGRTPIEPSTIGTDDGNTSTANDNTTDSENRDPSNNAALYFSSLNLKSGKGINIECQEIDMSQDIVAFNENMLANCKAVLEGTITNITPKEYAYTYERNGTLSHYNNDTIIYEFSVEKVWYGSFSETSCLIEDKIWFTDNIVSMKVGCSYVVPIYDTGSEFTEIGNYVSGDIKRTSNYSTFYPYHPQITITANGKYIVTSDWPTLTAVNAKKIDMDIELDKNASYYKDKFMLVSADDFTSQMAKLIENTILK